MYAATSNEQILNWLLHALNEHEEFKKRTETIVTDEDHAFRSAYNTWIKEINSGPEHYIFNHIFCALHKSRNFQNKLNKSGLNKSEKLLATQYFKLICYHPNKNLVKSIMEKLKTDFGPRISHYIEKHVESDLHYFSRAFISDVNCLGYNTTSPSESMNHMLKQSLNQKEMTLVESRKEFDRVLSNHSINCEILSNSTRYDHSSEIGLAISPKLMKRINLQMKLAESIVIIHKNDNQFEAYHSKRPSVTYQIKEDECSCNMVKFAGYPCCHLIAAYKYLQRKFPNHLINGRWVIGKLNDELNETLINTNETDNSKNDEDNYFEEEEWDANAYFQEESENSNENDREIMEEINDLEDNENSDEICEFIENENFSEITARERFLKLFHTGKELARLACDDPNIYRKVLIILRKEINEIINIPPDSFISEEVDEDNSKDDNNNNDSIIHIGANQVPYDALGTPKGARKKGAKKKLKNNVDHEQYSCQICCNNHKTENCKFYDDKVKAIKENELKYRNTPGRHCSICHGINHQNRSCPIRKKAQEYYQQSNFI